MLLNIKTEDKKGQTGIQTHLLLHSSHIFLFSVSIFVTIAYIRLATLFTIRYFVQSGQNDEQSNYITHHIYLLQYVSVHSFFPRYLNEKLPKQLFQKYKRI